MIVWDSCYKAQMTSVHLHVDGGVYDNLIYKKDYFQKARMGLT